MTEPLHTGDQSHLRSASNITGAFFETCLAQDRQKAERLLADDFSFTSPQDDHIDKTAFLEPCFPTVDRLNSQEILEIVRAGEDDVFILSDHEPKNTDRYRNTDSITVRKGRLVQAQVFLRGARTPKLTAIRVASD